MKNEEGNPSGKRKVPRDEREFEERVEILHLGSWEISLLKGWSPILKDWKALFSPPKEGFNLKEMGFFIDCF